MIQGNRPGQAELERMEATARGIANIIGPVFDRAGASFVLLGFIWGPAGFSTYISNAGRAEMIRALRECVARLEADEDMPPIRPGEPSA